jgi:hypothetical protein
MRAKNWKINVNNKSHVSFLGTSPSRFTRQPTSLASHFVREKTFHSISCRQQDACNDSSSLQQTERFTAGTTWKLARIPPSGWVCRPLSGAIGNPTRICGAAVRGATKEPTNPGPPPLGPLRPVCRFCRRGTLTTSLLCLISFLFLSRVTASRCTSSTRLDWTGLNSGRPIISAQRPALLTACEWATSITHGGHKGPVSCDSIPNSQPLSQFATIRDTTISLLFRRSATIANRPLQPSSRSLILNFILFFPRE